MTTELLLELANKEKLQEEAIRKRGKSVGIAAYNRGSLAIARDIEQCYLDNGGQTKLNREQLERAELLIERLEKYCLDVQAFYSDITCSDSAKGLVKGSLHIVYVRKSKTKKLERLLYECNQAHCDWVNSDIRFSVLHLQTCYKREHGKLLSSI